MRGNPPPKTPPPHSQCLCRSWHRSRSRVSSEQWTGMVGDWVSRRREGRRKGNRGQGEDERQEERRVEGGKERRGEMERRGIA